MHTPPAHLNRYNAFHLNPSELSPGYDSDGHTLFPTPLKHTASSYHVLHRMPYLQNAPHHHSAHSGPHNIEQQSPGSKKSLENVKTQKKHTRVRLNVPPKSDPRGPKAGSFQGILGTPLGNSLGSLGVPLGESFTPQTTMETPTPPRASYNGIWIVISLWLSLILKVATPFYQLSFERTKFTPFAVMTFKSFSLCLPLILTHMFLTLYCTREYTQKQKPLIHLCEAMLFLLSSILDCGVICLLISSGNNFLSVATVLACADTIASYILLRRIIILRTARLSGLWDIRTFIRSRFKHYWFSQIQATFQLCFSFILLLTAASFHSISYETVASVAVNPESLFSRQLLTCGVMLSSICIAGGYAYGVKKRGDCVFGLAACVVCYDLAENIPKADIALFKALNWSHPDAILSPISCTFYISAFGFSLLTLTGFGRQARLLSLVLCHLKKGPDHTIMYNGEKSVLVIAGGDRTGLSISEVTRNEYTTEEEGAKAPESFLTLSTSPPSIIRNHISP